VKRARNGVLVAAFLAAGVTIGDARTPLEVPTYAQVIEAGTVSFLLPDALASTVTGVGIDDAERVTVAAWTVTDAHVLTLTLRLAGELPATFTSLTFVDTLGEVSTIDVGRVKVVPAPLPGVVQLRPVTTRTFGEGPVLATVVVRNEGVEATTLTSIDSFPSGLGVMTVLVDGASIDDGRSIDLRLAPGDEAEISWLRAAPSDVPRHWLQVDPLLGGGNGRTSWTRGLGFRLERRP
jgi:hypothetical protein